MWMLLSDELMGDLDRGAFVLLRGAEDDTSSVELVYVNLLQPEARELVLLRGDDRACGDAFDGLAEDLEADDLLLQLLDSDGSEELDAPLGEGAWLEVDGRTLLELGSSAIVSVGTSDVGSGVIYSAGYGSIGLFGGSEDEADAYLNALAAVVGASDALLDADADSGLDGPFGSYYSRMKKGQA